MPAEHVDTCSRCAAEAAAYIRRRPYMMDSRKNGLTEPFSTARACFHTAQSTMSAVFPPDGARDHSWLVIAPMDICVNSRKTLTYASASARSNT